MNFSIDNNRVADLLEAEYKIIETHIHHDQRSYRDMCDISRIDDIHRLADNMIYNRRIIKEHLMKAEGILTAVYPEEFGNKESGWLYGGLLESWIKTVRQDPELSEYQVSEDDTEKAADLEAETEVRSVDPITEREYVLAYAHARLKKRQESE